LELIAYITALIEEKVDPNYIVTEEDIKPQFLPLLVSRVNRVKGPKVEWYDDKAGYGLKADKLYLAGDFVTIYGGIRTEEYVPGPYVMELNHVSINGLYGFKLSEKGRWINEESSNEQRRIQFMNLPLNVKMIASKNVRKGEWFFTDYGKYYVRNY